MADASLTSALNLSLRHGSLDHFFEQIDVLRREQTELVTKLIHQKESHQRDKHALELATLDKKRLKHQLVLISARYWNLKKEESTVSQDALRLENSLLDCLSETENLRARRARIQRISAKLRVLLDEHKKRMQPIYTKLLSSVLNSPVVSEINFVKTEALKLAERVADLESLLKDNVECQELEREIKELETENRRLECADANEALKLEAMKEDISSLKCDQKTDYLEIHKALEAQITLNREMEAKVSSLERRCFGKKSR
ncbi:centrosomal protein of 85 kDa-like [Schistocerca gregaria]|uniref:centrosomal protein of 85 kDa-like n=1 Tax=Schistocerca gregaria TaxID=7010 RepID=UPI00211E2F05|nr:centrosomal protein of 85 kDa-like [Schistocerca gregaria]